jgi:hypothetical protein
MKAREEAEAFVEGVFAKLRTDAPEERFALARRIGALQRAESDWRPPDLFAQPVGRATSAISDSLTSEAREAVYRAVKDTQLPGIYTRLPGLSTGFSSYPLARFDFTSTVGPRLAPLIVSCLDGTLLEGLTRVFFEAHSRVTRARSKKRVDLYPGDNGTALMEVANRFLHTEAELWTAAEHAGYTGGVPYPVRYEAVRWLWSPKIAGVAFCLRCGILITYKRRGRRSGTRSRTAPLCAPCIRSGIRTWPGNALMPDRRGTWWLHCRYPECQTLFRASGRTAFCPDHRHHRLTSSKRVRATH